MRSPAEAGAIAPNATETRTAIEAATFGKIDAMIASPFLGKQHKRDGLLLFVLFWRIFMKIPSANPDCARSAPLPALICLDVVAARLAQRGAQRRPVEPRAARYFGEGLFNAALHRLQAAHINVSLLVA